MIKTFDHIYRCFFRFFLRFRYPVSLPEDVASALGIPLSNSLTFQEFVNCLTQPNCCPTTLTKFMSREKAEEMFHTALRKEHFRHNSLFSYYFNEGWMEFMLQFDEQSRLRRIYIQHKFLEDNFELPIRK
jgi:hypothetical protein